MRGGGAQRAHLRGYLKEKQWRSNRGSKKDLYAHFIECWAEAERDIRAGTVTMNDLEGCIEWDYPSYLEAGDVEPGTSDEEEATSDPYWIRPGCGKVVAGKHAPQYRFARERKRAYFLDKPPQTYNQESRRRLCCVADGNGGRIHFSERAQGNTGRATKRREVGK